MVAWGFTYLLLRRAALDLFIADTGMDQLVRTMLDSRYELWGILPSFVWAVPARYFQTA